MLGWIAQQVIISLVLILLFHYIIVFITNTFTKPKIIDLVNKPTETYEDIYKTLHKDEELIPPSDVSTKLPNLSTNVSTNLPDNIKQNMQIELQEYLNDITSDGTEAHGTEAHGTEAHGTETPKTIER